jgi:hypothetical protein
LTVGIALITQMGEQADYLRFMPVQTPANRWRWWANVLVGGPGWVLLGVLKMLGGALLAYLAISHAVPVTARWTRTRCTWRPMNMCFPHTAGRWRHGAVRGGVAAQDQRHQCLCRLAGLEQLLLAPDAQPPGAGGVGGVQHLIAFMLMEMNVFQALGDVLGLYSNIAIAWMMAVVADLVINKPLGCRPRASSSSAPTCTTSTRWAWARWAGLGAVDQAHLGLFGPLAQAFSA